ncbi:simple sugar transport system substrate-binding protein [Paenibacillus shirakamiensis]|uniref:Simple sugar transport system substrate-binding protein n=1 Tax=Paenibacillus shirakamiensis TaxID=1265935 RepID=A0ABS4JIS8_9BACL|nr:sugar ABC transporter substrate-binding protein [Paenibacillus shirakamiensis]MBP2001603.1 simple sugar transport system substrate-binding protein [Paenibacillus shirakamiensis]
MKKSISIMMMVVLVFLTACTSEQAGDNKASTTSVTDKTTDKTTTDVKAPEGTTATTSGNTTAANADIPEKLKKPVRIALVTRITSGSFFNAYNKGVQEQVDAFGGQLKIYDSANDLAKMASNIEAAVNEKVDAILVNNGTAQALEQSVKKALDAGIPVVTYDSDLNLPGISAINQDDYMLAWQSLKKLAGDLNGKGNIAVLWVAGYLPMERRQIMIDAFKKRYPNIKEVARFGSATANTALDTQAQVEALLKKYPNVGDLQAIYSNWNEFTRGALQALKQAGRTDIKVYGIDLTDEELPLFQDANSPWEAAAATNPGDVGSIQARLAYQKIAGEKVPEDISIEPHLIIRSQLPKEKIAFSDLSKYVSGWGKSEEARSAWMTTLETSAKK